MNHVKKDFNKAMPGGRETSIYLISSDDGLLQYVNNLIKRKGVLGLTDSAGRIHYMVDARNSQHETADKVDSIVIPRDSDYRMCEHIVQMVFKRNGFNMGLIGSEMLANLVAKLLSVDDSKVGSLKDEINHLSEQYNMSYQTVERDMRYAIRHSGYELKDCRTAQIIRQLLNESKDVLHSAIFEKKR